MKTIRVPGNSSQAALGLDDQLGETRLAEIGLLDRAHQLRNFLCIRLEGVVADHPYVEEIPETNIRPVEVVLDRVLPGQLDELTTHLGPWPSSLHPLLLTDVLCSEAAVPKPSLERGSTLRDVPSDTHYTSE